MRATKLDLDIPTIENIKASLSYFIWPSQAPGATDLLAVISFECPDWFEPMKRRLALNELAWLNFDTPVNDVEDFDPWSKTVLLAHYKASTGFNGKSKAKSAIAG